jgi:hypothetical protein
VKDSDPGVERARAIARIFDRAYLDPILGFVLPGVGDVISSVFGLYIVGVALDRRLPLPIVARMLINLAVDTAVGAIPIAGDVFDAFFKANTRNLALLERGHASRRAGAGDWAFLAGAVVAAGLAIAVPVLIVAGLLSWIF